MIPKMVLMKVADYCPFGKIGLAFISFWALNLIFTFWVAVILFSGLLIHEIGHAWAAHSKGRGVKGIYMLPWFSGVCMYRNESLLVETDIFCALMGPVFSIVFALLVGIFSFIDRENVFAFCSFANALISLNALITIKFREYQFSMHDGTRIVGIILSGRIRGRNLMLFAATYTILIVIGLGIVFFTLSNTVPQKSECFFQPFFYNGISFLVSFFKEHI